VSRIRVVYPYPWFSPRFQHKDVVLFPRALAKQLAAGFCITKGPVVLGEESANVRALPRRLSMAANMCVAVAIFSLRRAFTHKKLSNELTILFNFNLVSAVLTYLFSSVAPKGHRFIVKADLNPQDRLFDREDPSAFRKRKLIAALFTRAHAAIVVETTTALEKVHGFAEFDQIRFVLCRNGVETRISNDGPIVRDIDVLVVTRFNEAAKAGERYLEVFQRLRAGLNVVVVGVGAGAAIAAEQLGSNLSVQVYDALEHDCLVQMMLRSRVFLNLSAAESFCLALMEAAEAGCRIISTDVGVAKDLMSLYPYVQVVKFEAEYVAAQVHSAVDMEATNAVCPGRFSWDAVLRMDCLVQKLFDQP
jgi:glycosyltransferase involved in cell wall biosynthesis